VLTMDLHADQIQGFFDIPVDNIYAAPLLLADVHKQQFDNVIVVSPDVGGVVRARAIAKRLDSDLAIIDKRRPDTANTLCKAATALKERGAVKVVAYCTHPVLSGGAVARVDGSDLDELVVTDTIPLPRDGQASDKIRVLNSSQLIAETIARISRADSVSSLFVD